MAVFTMEPDKIEAIYDFHSAPEYPSAFADGALVFGRKDPLVADAAVELLARGTVPYAVITGGIGKDSGDLAVPEAVYLGALCITRFPEARLYLETGATNGAENVRNSFRLIKEEDLPHHGLTAVAHATSLRRLGLMMQTEAEQHPDFGLVVINRKPTDYQFDGENPADQREAVAELLRIADWPNRHNEDGSAWLVVDPELFRPDIQDLVAYARDADTFFRS